jgi:hypothetical protein
VVLLLVPLATSTAQSRQDNNSQREVQSGAGHNNNNNNVSDEETTNPSNGGMTHCGCMLQEALHFSTSEHLVSITLLGEALLANESSAAICLETCTNASTTHAVVAATDLGVECR